MELTRYVPVRMLILGKWIKISLSSLPAALHFQVEHCPGSNYAALLDLSLRNNEYDDAVALKEISDILYERAFWSCTHVSGMTEHT